MGLYCPNCGNEVSEKYCTTCGLALKYINDRPYDKKQFDVVKQLHHTLDKFIQDNQGYENQKKGLKRKTFREKTYELNRIENYYYNLLNNPEKLSYYRDFDFYFGSISLKLNTALETIDDYLDFIKKWGNNKKEYMDFSRFENDVEKYVISLDDLKKHLYSIKNKIQDKIYDIKLQTSPINEKTLKEIIDYIFSTNDELNKYVNDINSKLKDNVQMDIFNFFNNKYGNIKVKMSSCLDMIKEIKKMLSQLSYLVENKQNQYYFDNKKYIKGKLSINQANIYDMYELNLSKHTIIKLIKDRNNGKYVDSLYDISRYGVSSKQMDYIRKKIIIKHPKHKIKKLPQNNTSSQKSNNEIIDINQASLEELSKIPGISKSNAAIIIEMRTVGNYIKSYEDLEETLQLQPFQTKEIRKHTSISLNESNNNKPKIDLYDPNKIEKDNNLFNENKITTDKNQNKIDINTANIDELSKLPGLNLIKAKKIIDLRQNNKYIYSYEDLQIKLNLNPTQINQIKDVIIISKKKKKNKPGRILDL